jgi:hypothetical protein
MNRKDAVELIGIAAIVGSLVFVGLQIKQDQQLAVAQLFAETDDSVTSLATLMNENRDVWLSGSRGDELSPSEEVVFQNLVMSARYGYASFHLTLLNLDALPPEWVARKFAYQLYSNPGMRRVWNERLKFDEDQSAAYSMANVPTQFEIEVSKFLGNLDAGSVRPSDIDNYAVW